MSINLGAICFASTVIAVAVLNLRLQLRFRRAVKELEEVCSKQGNQWSYWSDFRTRIDLFNCQGQVHCPDPENPEIKPKVTVLLDRQQALREGTALQVIVFLIGMGLTVLGVVVSAVLSGK
jgi:hypothetical protein